MKIMIIIIKISNINNINIYNFFFLNFLFIIVIINILIYIIITIYQKKYDFDNPETLLDLGLRFFSPNGKQNKKKKKTQIMKFQFY